MGFAEQNPKPLKYQEGKITPVVPVPVPDTGGGSTGGDTGSGGTTGGNSGHSNDGTKDNNSMLYIFGVGGGLILLILIIIAVISCKKKGEDTPGGKGFKTSETGIQ